MLCTNALNSTTKLQDLRRPSALWGALETKEGVPKPKQLHSSVPYRTNDCCLAHENRPKTPENHYGTHVAKMSYFSVVQVFLLAVNMGCHSISKLLGEVLGAKCGERYRQEIQGRKPRGNPPSQPHIEITIT